jgi:hypothetical protein
MNEHRRHAQMTVGGAELLEVSDVTSAFARSDSMAVGNDVFTFGRET